MEKRQERVIGRVLGEEPGPTLICVGSLHGNEPAGFEALRRVFARLEANAQRLRGEFVGLLGNRTARERRQRFINADLNRHWLPERIEAGRQGLLADSSVVEDRELDELRVELEDIFARARGPVFLLDFHSTSGDGPPFTTMSDTLENRNFAMSLPAPIIVGLEEEIEGTLTDFVADLGHIAIGFEGGQHDAESSIEHVAAAVWISLASAGLLEESETPEAELGRQSLKKVCDGLPRVFEVRFRHPVESGDGFQMELGFTSFQPIQPGQLLATDDRREYRARERGSILMPLYQAQGDDGYFEIHPFSTFWLWVSAVMRRLNLGTVVHWLPGVTRDPEQPGALLVNRKIARFFAKEIFHLLGYRRHRNGGDRIVFSPRRIQRH